MTTTTNTTSPLHRYTPAQLAASMDARGSGPQWTATCPAHPDRKRSLSIGTGDDGKVLLKCFAGCTTNAITKAMGIETKQLMPDNRNGTSTPPAPRKPKKPKTVHPTAERAVAAALWGVQQRHPDAQLVKTYNYGDNIVVARFSTKDFAQVHHNGEGWITGKPPVYPLYREGLIKESGDSTFAVMTEGEKDADNLADEGVVAFTIAGGVNGIVNNLKTADLSPLAGRDVVLLPDNDEAGRKCMAEVADILGPIASSIRIVHLPGLPDKGDASDWLDAGGDVEDLVQLAEATPTHEPTRISPSIQRAKEGRPFVLTDLGNAERFAAEVEGKLRYVWTGDRGRWHVWTGTRWQPDNAGAAMRLACKVARGIWAEIEHAEGTDKKQALTKHANKSESAKSIHAILDLARSRPGITTSHEDLDRDDWLLNNLTGTLDLRTGQQRPHNPGDLITKLSPVAYDVDATCPTYDKFIADIMLGRDDLVEYVERHAAYCLTGDHRHHDLPIWFGGGANGKTTLSDVQLHIAGDYGIVAPESLLTASKRDEHPTEIANLRGKRLVVASETPEGASLRINLLKKLTGDGELTGRFMRQDLFTFRRTHKLVLQTNNKPRITEQSHAVWRRLKLVPFDLQVPDNEQDRELPDKLRDEAPGILARWVCACLRWQRDGYDLAEPDVVKESTEDYRDDEDPLAEFIDTQLDVTGDPDDYEDRTKVYQHYLTWASLNNVIKPWGSRRFYDRTRRIEGIEDGNARKDGGKVIRPLTGVRLSGG